MSRIPIGDSNESGNWRFYDNIYFGVDTLLFRKRRKRTQVQDKKKSIFDVGFATKPFAVESSPIFAHYGFHLVDFSRIVLQCGSLTSRNLAKKLLKPKLANSSKKGTFD